MAHMVAKLKREPEQPADYPDAMQTAFMMKHYGRVLSWSEWWKERSDRMAPDGDDLKYDRDGVLTF
jgi:extradiol dioxygenase family protein